MRLLTVLVVLSGLAMLSRAQDTPAPALPQQVFGAVVFYNQGAPSTKVNGSFYAAIPMPKANPGTYLYNSVDIFSVGHGLTTIPSTGLAQHVVWFSPELELFGLVQGGVSTATSTAGGTVVTPAFGGGAGLNYAIGKGFYVTFLAKVVNAQSQNNLVGGVGVSWGR